jgi:hypothetical protein
MVSPTVCEESNVQYFCDPIYIDSEPMEEINYDKSEFENGMKDASYFAGFFTGLVNAGMNTEDALNIILSKIGIENNIKMAQINKDTTIQASKNQSILTDKNMI